MRKHQKLHVKIGDKVKIISGIHKNEIGEVIKINKKTGKLIIKEINYKIKHFKSKTEDDISGIKQLESPLHHSNVKLNSKEIS